MEDQCSLLSVYVLNVCVCVCVCARALSGVECTRPGNKFTLVHCEVLNSFDTEPGPKNESFVLGSSLA